jgi:hypothetical protein
MLICCVAIMSQLFTSKQYCTCRAAAFEIFVGYRSSMPTLGFPFVSSHQETAVSFLTVSTKESGFLRIVTSVMVSCSGDKFSTCTIVGVEIDNVKEVAVVVTLTASSGRLPTPSKSTYTLHTRSNYGEALSFTGHRTAS